MELRLLLEGDMVVGDILLAVVGILLVVVAVRAFLSVCFDLRCVVLADQHNIVILYLSVLIKLVLNLSQ